MKYSDINIGCIYNVIFDPVNDCEFNGIHLALVLKRNNDKKTYIVIPLTSEPNGDGINKINIGKINTLPTSLKNNTTYAVYNQIRTINANRFMVLKEGINKIESKIDKNILNKVLLLSIIELMHDIPQDDKINIYKKAYESELVIKAKDIAYTIIKINNSGNVDEAIINNFKVEIQQLIIGKSYTIEKKWIDDGIKSIFDDAIKDYF